MYSLHPHSILPIGSVMNVVTEENNFEELFPTLRNRVVLAASSCFLVPLFREYLISNRVRDCSRFNAKKWLTNPIDEGKHGTTICIVPGGAQEGLYANPEEDWLDLRRKKGFVRLALQTGVKLVPAYTFNEVEAFHQVHYNSLPGLFSFMRKYLWQKTIGISFPCIYFIGFSDVHLTTVVGAPIQLPYEHVENPTEEQLDECVDIYIKALQHLYHTHHHKYNSRPRNLVIS